MLCLNGLSSFCVVPGQVLPSYGMTVCLHCLRAGLNPFENCESSTVLAEESDHCLHLNSQKPQIPFPFFCSKNRGVNQRTWIGLLRRFFHQIHAQNELKAHNVQVCLQIQSEACC